MFIRKLFQLNLFERFQSAQSRIVVIRPLDETARRLPANPPPRSKKPRTLTQAKVRASDRLPENVPNIRLIWDDLVRQWFPDRPDLHEYSVSWSQRPQKRTLASCNPFSRQIWVARELQSEQYAEYLPALIYHEMCHAYLGKDLPKRNGKRPWHGREFKALERRHPGIPALNHWIRTRGWEHAVRSDRSKRAHALRKLG